MGRRSKDLTGERFGRLRVIGRDGSSPRPDNKGSVSMWLCVCDCGNTVRVPQQCLKNGGTQSCGCLRREKSTENLKAARSAWQSKTKEERKRVSNFRQW